MPSPPLSAALNRVHGKGLRARINDHRVADAAGQLAVHRLAEMQAQAIMFAGGFPTISSVNKAFAQRMGVAPSAYREQIC